MLKRRRESSVSPFDSYTQSDLSEVKLSGKSLVSAKTARKYDFIQLAKHYPVLKKHMILNLGWKPFMHKSQMYHYDFNHPDSVYHLSKAILNDSYNLKFYLPCGCEEQESCNLDKELELYNQYFRDSHGSMDFVRYLAPCVPNRLSYLRSVSALLTVEANSTEITELRNEKISIDSIIKGRHVVVMDIGTGASCIYPLLGVAEYSWSFIGTDIDCMTLELAKKNVDLNHLDQNIKLRMQKMPSLMFNNVLNSHELVTLTVCNPPFHSSLEKTNLNPRTTSTGAQHELVFTIPENAILVVEQSYMDSENTRRGPSVTGQLRYMLSDADQGELAFIDIMLKESKYYCHNVLWFTSLVAKMSTLKTIRNVIQREMRQYNLSHKQQEQVLNSKLDQLCYEDSQFKFATHREDGIDVSQVHACEFRSFTLKLGKQTRWVIAWTYYNSVQRIKIINNLANLATQQTDIR